MMLWICSTIFLILMLSCNSPTAQPLEPPATVNLSTTWGIADESMLVRETNVTTFRCGFYCYGDCINSKSNLFFISISVPDEYDSQVVWSANPDDPVGYDATLNFTADGELVLKDGDGRIVWTTKTAGKSVVGMNLSDKGNLVLFDDHNSVVWQSFEHPTDCLLPGQKLFEGQKLTSSASLTNYSQGMYYLQATDIGLFAYVESNPPQAYFSVLVHAHKDIKYASLLNGSFSAYTDSSDVKGQIVTPETSTAQYMRLMPDGHLQLFQWQFRDWVMVEDLSGDDIEGECDYPLACGRNSLCTNNQQCSCAVIGEYFRPVDERQPNLGCSEITPLTCNSTQDHQHFITLENVTYSSSTADMERVNMETCKQACLNNCSCKAAFFYPDGGDCKLPSELFTIRKFGEGDYPLTFAFIKVQNATSPPSSYQVRNATSPLSSYQVPNATSPPSSNSRVTTLVSSMVGSFVILLVLAVGLIMYRAHRRKRDEEMKEEYLDQLPGLPNRFSYEELKTATENFSIKLGQGGFGSVFEGTLEDGSKIAVKCLEGVAHVMKSFLAEIESIGSIHHVNLVRLRGFCAWRTQRLLVYEFMSNGSLDQWIYRGNQGHVLDWECRKRIVLDIARGLTYLHEDCRQKIIHLDIKPQNILLDSDFNAKVSDFGLSKLIERNQTEVMTSIKGTPGYIAPEWRSSIITEKMDVYSFGIVLLEILCGRKVFDRSEPEESWYLLFVFQKCWEQGTLLDMVDRHSEDMQVHKTEVVEMMKVTSWCLQTNFKRRPSMSSVVKVLEGGMSVEPDLNYNFTDLSIQEITVRDEKDLTQLSPFHLSGPR